MPESASSVKKTTRKKASASPNLSVTPTSSSPTLSSTSMKHLATLSTIFAEFIVKIEEAKTEFELMQKEIVQTRESWEKEKRDHDSTIIERNQQEEIIQKREEETYRYEVTLAHKKEEDEFREKKTTWERELESQKDELAKEKEELVLLRKQVASFPDEKVKTVKEACAALQKELTHTFETERKLREQEVTSHEEMLSLKIETLALEKARQAKEIDALKKALDEANREVKDIAVKVIESRSVPISTDSHSSSKEDKLS